MLVLSRKFNESVHLKVKGENGKEHDIKIQVMNVNNNKVKLGFETDKDVLILREELLNKAA